MADITLSVGIKQSVLTKSIKDGIKAAQQQGLTVKVTADVEALKKSIEKLPKIAINVNKQTFSSSVAAAIRYTNELKNVPKIQIKVDEKYLRQQVESALKGMGSLAGNGSSASSGSGSTPSGSGGSASANNELRETTKLASQTAAAYNLLNKVRTAYNNTRPRSEEHKQLGQIMTAIYTTIDAYKDAEGATDEYKNALKQLNESYMAAVNSARENNEYANSFSQKLQKFKMHLTTVMSVVRAFRMLAYAIRPVVNAVTEVDTALTQLRIVTQANDQAIQAYSNNIAKIADKTAGSVKDLINSTTTFARLGYSLDESSILAQYTQMLENVGDIDEASATSAMTAIVKAYGFGVDELSFVMDKLVDVGNHFPISVKELAEGMNNAGSMLAVATEGSFDQSIALLTAANTTIQNISKSSTGLRTIAARIRNVGTELDDLGETMTEVEYDAIVQALTDYNVSLTDHNGELRNTYDILFDLSQMWDTLSQNEQAALAKTLSGTRQQNVFISLMSNFDEASGAMERMATSEGALSKANDIYLSSIKAHTEQLKNSFVGMSQALLSSDTIKYFIDLAKVVVQTISAVLKLVSAVGGLKTILLGVITYVAILKGESIVASISNIISKVASLITSFGSLTAAMQAFKAAVTSAMSSASGAAGMAVAALMATVAAAKAVVNGILENLDALIDTGDKASENIKTLTDLYKQYTDVGSSSEEAAKAQRDLADALGLSSTAFGSASGSASKYADALRDALIGQLELDMANQLQGLEAQKEKIAMSIEHWDIIPKNQRAGDPFGIETWDLDYLASKLDYFSQRMKEIGKEFSPGTKEYDEAYEIYSEITEKLGEYSEKIKSYNESVASLTFVKAADSIKKYTNTGVEGFRNLRKELIDTIYKNEEFRGSEDDAAEAVDRFLSHSTAFDHFYDTMGRAIDGTSEFSKGLAGIAEVAKGTSAAVTELDNILKGDDYDTGLEKRVEYYDKLLEEIQGENWGGKHYKALADYFGVDITKSVDEQIAAVETLRRYFDDADSGMYNFLMDINQRVPDAIANFNSDTGMLKWDSARLQEFADAMGITRDALVDLLNSYMQHVPPSEWMALSDDEAARWMEQDEVLKRVRGTLEDTADTIVVNREKFDELAASGGRDADELYDAITKLESYEGVKFIEVDVDTSSIESAVAGLREFSRNTDDVEVKVAGIASVLSELSGDQVSQILVELNLPDDIQQRVLSMLPEDIQESLNLDTSESQAQLDEFNAEIDAVITTNDGRAITITVTDGGTIATLEHQLNRLVNSGTIAGYNVTRGGGGFTYAKNATGTKHARAGLSLLGDEYSASGKPKPELVVSDGRAYLAGIYGPVVRNLSAGDIVYTYEETKKILGNSLSNIGSIPAFAQGTATKWWNKISGSAGSYSSSSSYGSYYGTNNGSGSSASTSGSGDNWFEQQYELHNHYRKLDQETDQAYLTWLVGAWKQAYAQGIIELKDAHKYEEEAYKLMKDIAADAFKEEYQYHQHMLNMDQESDQEYYSWLEWRHQVAYTNNEITLDEYYKYQEEVYKKSKELIKDYFNDVDHKISMLENANKSNIEIIQWDEKGMEYAEERIAELIKEGKDNNDANVQEQQKTWWAYYKDRAKREEDTTKNAKAAAKELIDYRIKMLKQELNKEKDVLNDRLSAIKDFYSKQKELLQDQADEDKYLDEQAEKRKKVSDLEIQLAQIEYDNSAWAQKKRLELSQQLLDAQKELNEFEKEHALQVAKEKLDAIQEMQEKELQDQIDAIEKTTQSEAELYQKALHDVQNGGQNLYDAMVEYNNQSGTGNPEDIAEMWDDAYTSLKKYKEMFGEYYKDIKLSYGNDISPAIVDTSKIDAGINPVKPDLESKEPPPAVTAQAVVQQPATQPKPQAKADPVQGQKVRLKSGAKLARDSYTTPSLTPASWVIGRDLYIQAAYPGRNAPYHVGTTSNINDGASTWVGWVDKKQLEGYAMGTRNAIAGIHRINENGDEALFKTADGNTYRLFSGGEHVFNAGATDFLHNFADNPIGILAQLLNNISGGFGPEIKNNNMSQNISLGDIYIQGNATEKTVSEIRREKRSEIDYLLKELGRLNKQ